MLLKNPWFQRFGGGAVERLGIRLASGVEYLQLRAHKDRAVLRMLKKARWERKTLVTMAEAYILHSVASSIRDLPGDLAEVGVFEGSTAKILCELKGDKTLHLCDTFEGLPDGTTEAEKIVYYKTKYRCSLESVQQYLSAYDNVRYYKGYFPESAKDLDPQTRFALVHMDVDLYQSTLDCLRFFYPRMQPGGVLISHDYSILAGVEQAFREFLADKPENLIELPTTQCMVVKL